MGTLSTPAGVGRGGGLKVKAPDQARERTDDLGKLYDHQGVKQLCAGASLKKVWPDVTLLCLHKFEVLLQKLLLCLGPAN